MTPQEFAPARKPRLAAIALLATTVIAVGGCGLNRVKPAAPVSRYETLPPKQMPDYLRGTILERVDVVDLNPMPVSGYGLVVNLQGTGDNTQIPTPVREYMIREMVKRGFGSKLQPGFETTSPEEVLRDPRTAIVRVDGLIPPGARNGDTIDVRVSSLSTSLTSSLARGELYRTELKVNGALVMAPGTAIKTNALAQGPVFVNPAYVHETHTAEDAAARRSLRSGWVLDGAVVSEPRPLVLRLRAPERRMARAIEARIDNKFASMKESQRDRIASAKDEAVVQVTLPPLYGGDWEHFAGLMTHLFFDPSPQFATFKAKQLAEAALLPDAPLENISYAMEGLGPGALPFVTPLMTHERPDVAYAAARAAAFLGDRGAPALLAEMARTPNHPFQINAVRTLGSLPASPATAELLKSLLNGEQTLVRVEAYQMLAKQKDPGVMTRVIDEKFVLDTVPCEGTPIVYASRTGIPRIALIGPRVSVTQPFNYTTFDNRLTLVSDSEGAAVKIFYRPPTGQDPAISQSRADLAELIARLGGDRAARSPVQFCYTDVVALLQGLADRQQLVASGGVSRRVPAAFVLQSAPALAESMLDTPGMAPEQSRPAGDGAQSSAAPDPGKPAAAVEPPRPN